MCLAPISIFAAGSHFRRRQLATWAIVLLVCLIASVLTILPTAKSAAAPPGGPLRSNTVEFFAGQHTGATGANHNAKQDFAAQTAQLAETGVTIENAYVELSAQVGAATASTNYGSTYIYFDSCTPSPGCTLSTTAYATTGSLGTTPNDSQMVRFRADVTAEGDLAAYAGAATNLKFAVGYCFATGASCSGTTSQQIFAAHAKLVVTYTYDIAATQRTNTVLYPLEYSAGTGSNSYMLGACTINSNCEKWSYNSAVPEVGSQISQHFHVTGNFYQDGANDIRVTPQVDGNASGAFATIEGATGAQGGWHDWRFSGLSGYANNTAQDLELGLTGTSLEGHALGGENSVTYSYSANAAVRTKTVTYPVGELITARGSAVKSALTGPNVYLPETGAAVQKAWIRVNATAATGWNRLLLSTKVGSNAETGTTDYDLDGNSQQSQDGYLIHMIPSSDYAALQAASANTGVPVQVAAQWSNTAYNLGGNVSAELVVTYQYTGDSAAYQNTQTLFAGQQTSALATTFSTATGAVDPVLPETAGTVSIRGASLLANAKNNNSVVGEAIGANFVGGVCSATTTSTAETATSSIPRLMLWKDVTSAVNNGEASNYTACFRTGTNSIFGGALSLTYQVSTEDAGVVFAQAAGTGNDATATTIAQAFSGTNTAGNAIVAAVSWYNTTNRTMSCSDTSGNRYQVALVQNNTGTNQVSGICYATNIGTASAGGNTVTVTFGLTSTIRRLIVHEYSGVASLATLDRLNSTMAAAASTSPASSSVTTTTNGDLLFGTLRTYTATTVSAGSTFTKRLGVTGTSNNDFATEDRVQTTAGAATATWTTSNSYQYDSLILALRSSLSAPDNGAVQHNANTSSSSTTTLSTTLTDITGGNTIVIAAGYSGNPSFSCSDAMLNSYTTAITRNDATSGSSLAICYATGAVGGTYSVTITLGGASSKTRIIASEYENINAVYPTDGTVANNASTNTTPNAATSTAISTTTAGDIIYGAFYDATGPSLSNAGSNFARQAFVNGADLVTQDQVQATAGSIASTHSYGVNADRYIGAVVAFRRMPTLTQSNWRFYTNANSTDVGAPLAAQNTAPTDIATGTPFRLRMRMAIDRATYYSGPNLRLQYAQMSGSCDTAFSGETYGSVATNSGAIRFYNNAAPADNATATGNVNDPTGNTKVMQTYQEMNDTTIQSTVAPGQDALWDFSLVNNSATAFTSYCFRLVTSTGVPLDGYDTVASFVSGASNQNPNAPTATLTQRKADNSTAIATGGYTNETQVWLGATVSDPDASDTVQLCAEVASTLTSPASPASCGSLVSNNTTGSVNVTGLISGTTYRWQAKSRDNNNAYSSSYTLFNSGNAAFTVDTAAPTAGMVYDGAVAGSEAAFNSGSLQSLACNWSGFGDGVSGLAGFDVSFGTSAGATNVSDGVSGATSGWFTDVGVLNAGWYSYSAANVLNLRTGQIYFCNIRARDNAGNSVTVSSNGQNVAPTLSFSTSDSVLEFAGLAASNAYTDEQSVDLSISSNGYGGYVVSMYASSGLVSSSGAIPAYAAPWSLPTVWTGTGIGYTSSDSLVSGSNRFAGATQYAGLPIGAANAEIVADHTVAADGAVVGVPISGDVITVSIKVASSVTQAAGAYRSNVVFSATASF